MLNLVGNIALILLIVFSTLNFVAKASVAKIKRNKNVVNRYINTSFFICVALIIVMIAILEYAFINTDLAFKIVYLNSHQIKPLIFKIAGVWANHEGSMLLWLLALSISGLIYLWFSKSDSNFTTAVLSIQSLNIAIFGLYIYFTSNPFEKNLLVPEQGLGLNPILQDIGLLFHPPSLYLGYVGFSITYSIALSILLYQRGSNLKDAIWDVKVWSLFSWAVLTFGILMGSLWSYRELGWGGYWFWDPVENASLIPWLISNALIHSIFLFERRKLMFGCMILSAILTYASSILGTFVVRSGILNSVHTFASAPERGTMLLIITAFLLLFGLGSYCSYLRNSLNHSNVLRNASSGSSNLKEFVISKELFLLFNNIIMLSAAAVITFATLYPIVAELVFDVKLSVGPKYYNTVMQPIAIAVIILSFLANNTKWASDTLAQLKCRLNHEIMFLALSLYLYLILPLTVAFTASILGIFIINLYKKFKQSGYSYGTLLSDIIHFGFALLVFSIIANSTFEKDISYKLEIGEAIEFDGKIATLNDIRFFQKDNYLVRQAVVSFGKYHAYPENRIYIAEQSAAQESYRIKNFVNDYYFAINSTEGMGQNEIILNITLKAFINLIWISGYIIVFAALSKILLYLIRRFK